ncbi:MAG: YggS family pyridoxal phosphate-dependent enzyme [Gammaproteobacteria bacterium]|nr:MAG: YggS family pyridoxal phosphate-dependent enzyme [Gammaproteobacteria bacterium]
MPTLTERFEQVKMRIKAATIAAERPAGAVTLVAVSKARSASEIADLHRLGQHAFGESYLQEALVKLNTLAGLPLEWHFIGPLQANKTRHVAEHFAWAHSVDRLKLAKRLSEQRPTGLPPLNICLQVNISGEPTKSGIRPDEVPKLAAEIANLPGLRLRGLMAIPAVTDDIEQAWRPFRLLRELAASITARGIPLDTLSMGMSDDLEAAVMEGATLVRVGTALFGPRPPRDVLPGVTGNQ